MSINKISTLSFSLYFNKGAYAVLLGSGISRSAHIPSTWEVENELIERLASTQGVSEIEDWHRWYKEQYEGDADYSSLLNDLVSTKTERVGLLKSFFEPSEEDKEMGWKTPTIAHKAIAKLAKEGYIKIILTTNFDRLIEDALNQEGVTYQVILHESDLEKITPITHCTTPTIVKINGDYIDCRFRNTTSELSSYPEDLKNFLSRIFEDYGLITCGWSASWDVWLVNVIKKSRLSRYNSFFSYIDNLKLDLEALANERKGETIKIESADQLFNNLYEQVSALERNEISKRLNKDIILSRVEKYLEEEHNEIKLTKLVEELSEEAYNKIAAVADYSKPLNREQFTFFLSRHHDAISNLIDVAIIIGRWGKPKHFTFIGEALVKLCVLPSNLKGGGLNESTKYCHGLAPTLLLNALGISCTYYNNYAGLNEVVTKEVPAENYLSYHYRQKLLTLVGCSYWGYEEMRNLTGTRDAFAYSKLLNRVLKEHFHKLITPESEYEMSFNKWEHLESLLIGYHKCHLFDETHFPIGYFVDYEYRERSYNVKNSPYCDFFDSAVLLKEEWSPIKQGLFGGKYENYKEIYDKSILYYQNNRHICYM